MKKSIIDLSHEEVWELKEKRKKEFDRIISQLVRTSKSFIETSAFTEGEFDLLLRGELTSSYVYEYEYFMLTKSTKTLDAIKSLVKKSQNEDALILSRTIFENYLVCRYYNYSLNSEKAEGELHEELVLNPILLSLAHYNIKGNSIIDRDNNEVGKINNPSKNKTGKDKKYYSDLYEFLCMFTHPNFGTAKYYKDGYSGFDISKENLPIFTRYIVTFVFIRLFESIVTVEGEDFKNQYLEEKCYKLVKEVNIYLDELSDEMIKILEDRKLGKDLNYWRKRRIKLIKNMKKALREELGSVKKFS